MRYVRSIELRDLRSGAQRLERKHRDSRRDVRHNGSDPRSLSFLETIRDFRETNRLVAAHSSITLAQFYASHLAHEDTASGLKNIEDVQGGDSVLARAPRTGQQVYKPVLRTVVTHPTRLYHVRYQARQSHARAPRRSSSSTNATDEGDGEADPAELVATGEHPFFVVGSNRFVPADSLKPGDLLATASGGLAEVLALEVEESQDGEPFTTYNFEVDDFHTYFVGEEGVWVHNAAGRECQQLRAIYLRMAKRGKTPNKIFRKAVADQQRVHGAGSRGGVRRRVPWSAGRLDEGTLRQAEHSRAAWHEHMAGPLPRA